MISLLPLIIEWAPSLIGFFVGGEARNVTEKAITVAREVFGSDDPDIIKAKAAADQSLKEQFIAKLTAETEQFKIATQDTASARQHTIALAQSASPMAWGAVVISVIVTIAFCADLAVLCFVKMRFDDITGQVFILLTGTLSAAFTQVIAYWLGSSAGSRDKDFAIRALTAPQPQAKKK